MTVGGLSDYQNTLQKNYLEPKIKNMKTNLLKNLHYYFIYIVLFVSCNFFLSNTEYVKNSVLNTDYSMKIGDALDNYKYFKKTEWNEFTTKQGQEVVEFNGYYNQNDIVVRIQFIINKDRQEDADGLTIKESFEGYRFLNQSNDESVSWSSDPDILSMLGLSDFINSQFSSSLMTIIFKNEEIKLFSRIENPEDKEVSEKSNDQSFELNNFPSDFVEFIGEFSTNADFQIEHIKFPLLNLGLEKPTPIKEQWQFINEDSFFEGIEKSNDGTELHGHFEIINPNKISYGLGIPESEWVFYLVFEKIDREWMLVEYMDLDMQQGYE